MREALFHLPRLFAERNDDRSHVFATGERYGRAERRESVRLLVGIIRRGRAGA